MGVVGGTGGRAGEGTRGVYVGCGPSGRRDPPGRLPNPVRWIRDRTFSGSCRPVSGGLRWKGTYRTGPWSDSVITGFSSKTFFYDHEMRSKEVPCEVSS